MDGDIQSRLETIVDKLEKFAPSNANADHDTLIIIKRDVEHLATSFRDTNTSILKLVADLQQKDTTLELQIAEVKSTVTKTVETQKYMLWKVGGLASVISLVLGLLISKSLDKLF